MILTPYAYKDHLNLSDRLAIAQDLHPLLRVSWLSDRISHRLPN